MTPLETVLFMGKWLPAPNQREDYLALRYGEGWKECLGVDSFTASRRSPADFPSKPPPRESARYGSAYGGGGGGGGGGYGGGDSSWGGYY